MQKTKYTDKEAMQIMDSVAFPKGLSIFQTIKITYWALFERKKLYKFCDGIERGKSLHFALKDAEETIN